jgi:hypothetical protein
MVNHVVGMEVRRFRFTEGAVAIAWLGSVCGCPSAPVMVPTTQGAPWLTRRVVAAGRRHCIRARLSRRAISVGFRLVIVASASVSGAAFSAFHPWRRYTLTMPDQLLPT